jgi:hypothetical protein
MAIIEARIRVEDDLWGKFCVEMAKRMPYAMMAGYDVLGVQLTIPSPRNIPSPQTIEHEGTSKVHVKGLNKMQRDVLHLINAGHMDRESIRDAGGFSPSNNIVRVIRTLRARKLVKGIEGSYTLTERGMGDE